MQRLNEPRRSRVSAEERARLRRNQRNSRARRQAYVEDLERRWSDCVAKGAQATMEMQQAARQVHNENAQLRSMLHEVGFSNEQIAQRLSGIARSRSDDHKRLPIPQTLLPNATPTSQYQPTNTLTPSQHHSSGTGSPTNESSLDAGGGTAFLAQRPMIHSQQSAAFPTSQWDDSLLPGPEQPIPNTTTGHLLGGQTALPEWDLYTWLTDLSNIKDAFGAGVNDYVDDSLAMPGTQPYDLLGGQTAQQEEDFWMEPGGQWSGLGNLG